MTERLTHNDDQGKARMVDIGQKAGQQRAATAQGFIRLAPETIALIRENAMKKGDVTTVAEIAGIMAAKQTSNLIPLCHPLQLSHVSVNTFIETGGLKITASVKCTGKTGVEMEALTAVAVSLLTVYDMCKAVDKSMVIEGIKLIEKTKK